MNDVSAVVLTIGEPSTERALASIRRQTRPVAQTVVVRGVSPFYRAMNTAAARVRTPFFIQVDADMILDPTGVADLRGLMAEGIGIVVGQVRDPLRGRIAGLKLYRTDCFAGAGFRDTICQDTDFADAVQARGWRRVYALRRRGARADWHTFAAHEPDYATSLYTFYKFVTEGARSRQRPDERRFLSLLRQLGDSRHPAAALAVIGIAHGLFQREARDRLMPSMRSREFDRLEQFLGDVDATADAALPPLSGDLFAPSLGETFARAHALGTHLGEQRASEVFLAQLDRLRRAADVAAAVALVGLCRGLLRGFHDAAAAARDFTALRELLFPENAAAQARPSRETSGA